VRICLHLQSSNPADHRNHSGGSALSPDESLLAVHNLEDGLDLYRLRKKKGLFNPNTFKLDDHSDENYPVSVAFLHEGQGVVSGAQKGNVCVWETASGDRFQVLGHEGLYRSSITA
jgi:WD40 repeat protein